MRATKTIMVRARHAATPAVRRSSAQAAVTPGVVGSLLHIQRREDPFRDRPAGTATVQLDLAAAAA